MVELEIVIFYLKTSFVCSSAFLFLLLLFFNILFLFFKYEIIRKKRSKIYLEVTSELKPAIMRVYFEVVMFNVLLLKWELLQRLYDVRILLFFFNQGIWFLMIHVLVFWAMYKYKCILISLKKDSIYSIKFDH